MARAVGDLAAEFDAEIDFDPETVENYGAGERRLLPSWNIPPRVAGPTVPVVLESAKGGDEVRRWLEMAQWSLTPPYSKEPVTKYSTFNAVAETVAEKATFRGSVGSKRLIFPVDGYWEWKKNADGTKTRYYIHGPDGAGLAMGGLYSWWPNKALPEDHPAYWTLTATILTMPAVGTLADIHHRTPLTLPRDFWDEWLSQSVKGDQKFIDHAVDLAAPEALQLEFYATAPAKGNTAELLNPA